MPRGNCSDSVRITFLDAVGLLERLQEIVDRILREGCRVKEIRVVGSVARGDHTGDSDLDLLVILRGKPPGDRLEWIRDLYRYFDLPVGVDLFVCDEAELESDPAFRDLGRESRKLADCLTSARASRHR
jgi:uncharacterized protein